MLTRNDLRTLAEPYRLMALDTIYRDRLDELTQARIARLGFLAQLKACTEHGMVRVLCWQRDCDCSEGWHSYLVEARHAMQRIERDREGAEGPMSHHFARPSQVHRLPASRDRALEAFENGHPWSV
jgi:hypothetical protein